MIFVVIPAKPFNQAKTRLAARLPQPERARLSRSLFLRTLHLARQAGEVVVVSRDSHVRRLAKEAGAWALVEAGTQLNSAIRQASQWVVANGGETLLIVPGDLPFLTLPDLTEMIALGQQAPVVIAPDHRQEGTNGLLLNPPGLIEVAFGENSFQNHLQAARQAGVEPAIYHSPTLAFDLDWPEDLAKLVADQLDCRERCGL
jgi:2-phospho-L-lactate/phosphoenolpyruvate guanylyltransferase